MSVDIISMSWTIPAKSDPKSESEKLDPADSKIEKAVEAARKANILMFGSASDQGAGGPPNPYMARKSNKGNGPVICIGGARETRYADTKATPEAEFYFPGQTHGIPGPLPHMKHTFGSQIGSSVATALAS